jgi:hypothetical protein
MQEISYLIGSLYRTIKHYINLYRIIRTLTKFRIEQGKENAHYFAAMLMFAAITGLAEMVREFFKKIELSENQTFFSVFLTVFISMKKDDAESLQTILSNIQQDGHGILEDLGYLSMEKFKNNSELVYRFSFREFNAEVSECRSHRLSFRRKNSRLDSSIPLTSTRQEAAVHLVRLRVRRKPALREKTSYLVGPSISISWYGTVRMPISYRKSRVNPTLNS